MTKKIATYLNYVIEQGGSDLHVKVGSEPHIRVNGELLPISNEKLSEDMMLSISQVVLTPSQQEQLAELEEIDTAYSLENGKRFRINFFHYINGLGAVFRAIPDRIPTIEELHLPDSIKELAELESGIVLVTGATGSGKSTTLASILDRINHRKRKHIVSIEDPIEYLLKEDKALVTQRAVGNDTQSFSSALHSALREDIDILFIGELRDLETMRIALHAAQTGHLVLSTLHTVDAKESIRRIIGIFPEEEQDHTRMTFASVLKAVVSQRLVKGQRGGRLPAVEIMKQTARVSNLITENRDEEILEAIESGHEAYGTQSFDQSLLELYRQAAISQEEALRHATNPSDILLVMQGVHPSSFHDRSDLDASHASEENYNLKSSS